MHSLYLTLIFVFVFGLSPGQAQPLASPTGPATQLERIERARGSSILGSSFTYKGRRLGSPFSVEVPLLELNDPVVNRHLHRFKTWITVGRLTMLVPVIYRLIDGMPVSFASRSVYVSSLFASVSFSMLSNNQINKAVQQYNRVLERPQVGFGLTDVPAFGAVAVGGGVVLPLGVKPAKE